MGERGRNYPAAESLRGRRINTGGHRKVLTMSQALYSTADLLPKALRFEHGGAKFVSCPGRHLTSLRPCIQVFWYLCHCRCHGNEIIDWRSPIH